MYVYIYIYIHTWEGSALWKILHMCGSLCTYMFKYIIYIYVHIHTHTYIPGRDLPYGRFPDTPCLCALSHDPRQPGGICQSST